MIASDSRTVRIFVSSTFRDFPEERDLLGQRVFPALRGKLKDRFVELVDVDLRWGITEREAERGEVLPICLAEIERSRPYFVALLGERYGWVPPPQKYGAELLEQQPWLEEHRGGKSITELEILYGVLNKPEMESRAFFYFRAPDYARKKGGEYLPNTPQNAEKQADLKERIRKSGFPVFEYSSPKVFADRIEENLWRILDETFPEGEVPDEFERESLRHEAYAFPRRRLYLGGKRYIKALDDALAQGSQRVLIEGVSGSGKSALIANWLDVYRKDHPDDLVHPHYLAASADAADPVSLVRRLIEAIKRMTGSAEEIPGDPEGLIESLPIWLSSASAYAGKEGTRLLVVIDGLNALSDLRDLRWLPSYLPEHVHMVVSCLPGEVLEALKGKGDWKNIIVTPLTAKDRKSLLVSYLARYDKTLPPQLVDLALSHPLGSNPLFLRTIAEEMRLFGVHEELKERLDHYLESKSIDDLFERVLARVEENVGNKIVRRAMESIWGSRSGLTEEEILELTGLKPATWAPIRYALDEALLESGGRLNFAHDYVRIAISDRYLAGNNELIDDNQSAEALKRRRALHARLAAWFETRPDARTAEEVPWQWRKAEDWDRLKASLTRKEMFEAVYDNRGNEELLSYWLELEKHAVADLERDYGRAWKQWHLNEEVKETGDLAFALEGFLAFAGRYGDFTERLARLSFEIDEKVLGAEDPDTAASLNNLALLLEHKGDYAAAEPLYRRALAMREKALGAGHPRTATNLNNLAALLDAKGDYAAAEPLYRRALAIDEKALGAEHPDTATSLNNLAMLLQHKGDDAAAEPLYRRALAICEKALGAEHPDTATSVNNLAMLLQHKGDDAAAEPLYRRALAIKEKALGAEHPDTAVCLNNLAVLLEDKGDYDAAEPLYRRALAIDEKARGAEHPDTARNLNNLAELLRNKGDYAAAEPLYRRALAIAEKALGAEHSDTAVCLNNLAGLLDAKGDYAGAEPLYRRALAITEKALGAEHSDTAVCLNNLAGLLVRKGHEAAAEPLYRRALAIKEKALGAEHPKTAKSLYALGDFLAEQERFGEAETLLRRELRIAGKINGPESESVAESMHNLGVMLRDAGRLDKSEPLLQRAIEITEKTYGTNSLESTPMRSALAQLHLLREDYKRAEELFLNVFDIRRRLLPPGDERIHLVETRLADLYERTDRPAEAAKLRQLANTRKN